MRALRAGNTLGTRHAVPNSCAAGGRPPRPLIVSVGGRGILHSGLHMSPDRAIRSLLVGLENLLPAVSDGDTRAIHQARVTTRRLRALVPVLSSAAPASHWDETTTTLKRLARSLGKARDVDVSLALVAEMEQRAPLFAPVLAVLRTRLFPRQLATRRKLVRRLEAVVPALREIQAEATSALRIVSRSQFDRALWCQTAEQAVLVRKTLEHTGVVYFARRAHHARIEVKELRYLIEMADDTEAHSKALKLLKKSQETLGRVQDREVLLKHLGRVKRASGVARSAAHGFRELLEAEIRVCYAAFVGHRPELGTACEAIRRWATSQRVTHLRRRMLTAGALGLPSAAAIILARRAAR